MATNFFIIDGKFATRAGEGGFYTISEPTISPDVEPVNGEVELTPFDKVVGATNTIKFYSNVSTNDSTKALVFN